MTTALPTRVSTNTAIRGSLIEESYRYFEAWGRTLERTSSQVGERDQSRGYGRSASWDAKVEDEMRRRFDPEGSERALAILAAAAVPLESWRPLLLWHLARRDLLLYDFLTCWLYPRFANGTVLLRAPDIWDYLGTMPGRGLLDKAWSEKTISRVASQLLHLAEDFGLLRGKLVREFTSYHLPDESLLYLLHAMRDRQLTAREVLHSPDWRLFLMASEDVERELYRLHQYRKVHFEVAGSVVELSLPYASALEYVRTMVA
jgi:hypothetical protein